MACRGVYFALVEEDLRKLRALNGDEAVLSFVQGEIEERWDVEWLQEVDKAWDAIHRCLGDGSLRCKQPAPLAKFVLCGERLYQKSDYIISLLQPSEVEEVHAASRTVTKEWFRKRYFELGKKSFWKFSIDSYAGPINEDDLEYSWSYFEQARELFGKATAGRRAMIFTVDQ